MTRFPEEIAKLAKEVVEGLAARGETIATAESCTGGLIAGALTSISGSSAVVYGGFVTYANEAKVKMIGVSDKTLDRFGAVSEEVAREMAYGAKHMAGTTYGIAVTGIAGPSGGSPEKPVGLVHFALAGPRDVSHRRIEFGEIGRDMIREKTVGTALSMILAAVQAP